MDCLITKLKGVVNDSSLRRLGEMRIEVQSVDSPSGKSQGFRFEFANAAKLEIIGDGYFTDATLSENRGKSLDIPGATPTDVFVSNGDFEVAVLGKYDLSYMAFNALSAGNDATVNRSFALDELRYSSGVYTLDLSSNRIKGELSYLIGLDKMVSLNLEATAVSGNISALSGMANLSILYLNGTGTFGDVLGVAALKGLTIGYFTGITGDIEELRSLGNLSMIAFYGSKLSGDLSKMPSSCRYIALYNDTGSTFTWTSRPESATILSMVGGVPLDDVDNMLIDQAKCSAGPDSKVINVIGTRTSASDDAVETLQEKGYTVSVTKSE